MAIVLVLLSVALGFGLAVFASGLSSDVLGRRLNVLPAVLVGAGITGVLFEAMSLALGSAV